MFFIGEFKYLLKKYELLLTDSLFRFSFLGGGIVLGWHRVP